MMPYSERFTGAPIFWATFLLWIVLELIASRTKRSADRSHARDRGSYSLIVVLLLVGLTLDFTFTARLPQAAILWKRSWVFFSGIGLMLAGIAFRWWAITTLGKFFTFDVAVQSGQKVVNSGPYRYIRHPSYTGALMTQLGIGLALGNWAGLLAFMLCMTIAYWYRIRVEERELLAALGEPYQRYMQSTHRIIPFLL
ncbi:MAG: isoprenylcysteine carboxylmethyltransferase family protein [Acidobacteriota bacterium]|nr:isoprenylcysteine carboxylmethyltransferase family protein [Acidobacteriota bacterium]